MHEIEELIRLALKTGPQKGSDVRLWVAEATGFSDRKICGIAEEMAARGDLRRGLWAVQKIALPNIGGRDIS